MPKFEHISAAIFDQPWGILPEKLEAICEVVERRISGENLALLMPAEKPEAYTTDDGVRVIPLRVHRSITG